ncbi:very short patch repair endonuclease [Streptomyces microflavus]|uniref:very short patch repair endonuclease n=1 Tax=Streptomyces microflavus TaxID=1919 RepID=UPI003808034B
MSESSLLDQVLHRVLGSPEDDPPVTVTERDKVDTWRDAGLGEQPEGKIDTAMVVDVKLSWFPKHGGECGILAAESLGRAGTTDMAEASNTPGGRWVRTEKGDHLRGRRARDTAPELALRRAVHRLGLRFRLQRKVATRCTADFVLPRYGIAVFVDGCFWHGCPTHGPAVFRGPNATLWAEKIATNKTRDLRNTKAAEAAGWTVVRIWECEIRRDAEGAAQRVVAVADSQGAEDRRRSTSSG